MNRNSLIFTAIPDLTEQGFFLFLVEKKEKSRLTKIYSVSLNKSNERNSQGEEIGHIAIPERGTSNVCFIGNKKDFLFITSGKSIYKIKMKIKGV